MFAVGVLNRGLLVNLSRGFVAVLEGDVIRDLLLTTMLANWQTAVLVRYGSDRTDDLLSGLDLVSIACANESNEVYKSGR